MKVECVSEYFFRFADRIGITNAALLQRRLLLSIWHLVYLQKRQYFQRRIDR